MSGRLLFESGVQRLIIGTAKERLGSWKNLASYVGMNESYLKSELRKEQRTISEEVYKKLCSINGRNYDGHVTQILDENWGRRKGGSRKCVGRQKIVDIIEPSVELAEIVGIMLGDGNIYRKQYAIRICGHIEHDKTYLLCHVNNLFERVFGLRLRCYMHRRMNEMILYAYSKFLVYNMEHYGLVCGNKKSHSARIPDWILGRESYTAACVRGIFDTDGTVFFRKGSARMEIASAIPSLRTTFEKAMYNLGFRKGWKSASGDVKRYGIYSRRDIERFINIISMNNPKHRDKLPRWCSSV